MAKEFFFGIDTSNYTTSAAAVSSAGDVVFSKRHLSVPLGERGVRQSDALFCHTRDLPEIIKEVTDKLKSDHPDHKIVSIGVSTAPRKEKGSYMPCFLAGMNAALSSAEIFSVPCREFSHQEGHIAAAIFGLREDGHPFPESENFYAFHLSGGTSELMEVKKNSAGYESKIIASTLDITLGQFIDRCGVKSGLPFPSGRYLDEMALKNECDEKIIIAKKESGINISGFENKFDLLKKTKSTEYLASFVFKVVEKSVKALMDFIPEDKRDLPILFSGGVCSSDYLKEKIKGDNIYFSPKRYASDNAVGIAYLTEEYERNGK